MVLTAPRVLNEPLRCRFSPFTLTGRPTTRASGSDECRGVTRAMPSIRPRAAWMSARVGLSIAHPEDLLEDLLDGCERVELAGLDGIEQAAQRRLLGDRLLDVHLRAGRRDGKHL